MLPGSINPQSREDIAGNELGSALAGPGLAKSRAGSGEVPAEQLPVDEQELLSALGYEPVDIDSLAVERVSAPELSRLLVSLSSRG